MIIQTRSFRLATYERGIEHASKLALVLPGKLDTKDYPHMHSHVDYLAAMGYHAVSFDPSGTWESPGPIELYNFTNYLLATQEIIEYFGNKPTFVMGHSLGATAAIATAVSNQFVTSFTAIMPAFIKGDHAGIVNKAWQEVGYSMSLRDKPLGGDDKVVRFELPYSYFENQVTHDITANLKACIKPKQFILGLHDPISTPDTVRKIYALAGEPKQLDEFNMGHDYRHYKQQIDEIDASIGNFIASIESST